MVTYQGVAWWHSGMSLQPCMSRNVLIIYIYASHKVLMGCHCMPPVTAGTGGARAAEATIAWYNRRNVPNAKLCNDAIRHMFSA
jgi:hypothetical protein